MIKITMVLTRGVWDAEDDKMAMSITDAVGLEPGQEPHTSDMTYTEVADFVFGKVSNTAEVQHVFMTIEDMVFCANRFDDGNFRLLSADRFSGKSVQGSATTKQLAAILYVALEGPDASRNDELYPIAESVVETWPNECRPLP